VCGANPIGEIRIQRKDYSEWVGVVPAREEGKMSRPMAGAVACLFALYAALLLPTDALAFEGVDGMRLLGRNDDEFAHMMDFQVVGDKAYASVGLGLGFHVYDISDPTDVTRVTRVGLPAWRSWIGGTEAYSFAHDRGVQILDISGGGSAVLLKAYDPPGTNISYEGGVLVGDLLYVAAHQRGIYVLDLDPESDFAPIDQIVLTDNASWNVVESGGYIFVANGRFGLSIVDLSGAEPVEVGILPLPGLANDVEVAGDVAFLSLAADGVASVDVSDPANPILLDRAATLGNAFTMGLEGNVLGVGSYGYLEWFDVSDPSAIERAGWDATLVYAMGADVGVVSGDTVVVVADWRGMGVYAPGNDPTGDIEVYPTRLDFGPVSAAGRDTIIEVRNSGAGALVVTSIDPPAEITVDPASFTLGPGETQPVTVTAAGTGSVRSTIRYHSDDPDEPESVQYVYKNNHTFPQVGSLAPDFSLFGTDGEVHTLSDYRGKVVYLEFGASW